MLTPSPAQILGEAWRCADVRRANLPSQQHEIAKKRGEGANGGSGAGDAGDCTTFSLSFGSGSLL